MRKAALTALALSVLLLLSPASAAWADDDDDDDRRSRRDDSRGRRWARGSQVGVSGTVVGIDTDSSGFVVQSESRFWNVRLSSDTIVEFRGREVRGSRVSNLRFIQPGSFVRVQGRLLGNGVIRAREIVVGERLVGQHTESDRGLERQPGYPGHPVYGQPGTNLDLTGVVTSVGNEFDGIFQLNAAGRLWNVRLLPNARVETFNGLRGTGPAAVRILRAGDAVGVRGQVIANDQIWARSVEVGRQVGTQPVVIQPPGLPPIYNPYPGQVSRVIILHPADGSQVSSEFVVVGQTTPGATVQVDVRSQYNLLNLPVASGTVTADSRGNFTFPVRPAFRLPGSALRITATSSFQGGQPTSTAITVRQS